MATEATARTTGTRSYAIAEPQVCLPVQRQRPAVISCFNLEIRETVLMLFSFFVESLCLFWCSHLGSLFLADAQGKRIIAATGGGFWSCLPLRFPLARAGLRV